MKNLFKKNVKAINASSIEKLEKGQLSKVIGGTDEAERITFKAKEGATLNATQSTDSIQDEGKGFSSIIR